MSIDPFDDSNHFFQRALWSSLLPSRKRKRKRKIVKIVCCGKEIYKHNLKRHQDSARHKQHVLVIDSSDDDDDDDDDGDDGKKRCKRQVNMDDSSHAEESSSSSSSKRRQQDARKEDAEEEDTDLCRICFEANRDTILLPCGHYFYCTDCVEKLAHPDVCPYCREKINTKHKVYS